MSKKRGKHTTVIEGLDKLLKLILKEVEVDFACGLITPGLPTAKHLVKIKQLSGGVKLIYRSTRTKQVLYLYGNGEKIEEAIIKKAKKLKIGVVGERG